MTRELVLLHGRAQEGKDAVALKADWVAALRRGLAKSGLELPVDEGSIRFPYYGDALMDLVGGRSGDEVADIVVRGTGGAEAAELFLDEVLREVQQATGITDEQVEAEAPPREEVVARGIQNSRFVIGLLRALDKHVPGASGPALAVATNDVYHYLRNVRISEHVAAGVRRAMSPGVESVVVAHSLGSVVAYKLLDELGEAAGWRVPALVTVGSPLGLTAVRRALRRVGRPAVVESWFNALDPEDVVALFPLAAPRFATDPPITNKADVDNPTPNQHGISGYLEDADVARVIHDALAA